MSVKRVDVAIIGGGLAGGLLARQLRRTLPELSVTIVERAFERSLKVGESTVEIASHYMSRRLGLSTYLYENHLPKNGLRFFFDTPERETALTKMSELGSYGYPPLPAFQIDRSRFEADLLAMNREDGVDVQIGARAHAIALDEAGQPRREHRLEVSSESGESTDLRCRWLIDASGRAQVLSRQRRLKIPSDHGIAAVWGRFRGVADMDDIDDKAWNARVRYTHRVLSTNHFCYPGYWIWFIPISRGVTSVGVVCEHPHFSAALRRPEGFWAFLRGHRAVRELLESAELIDVMSYNQLAYGSSQFFGADGWHLTGEAAAFSDPFYSPGSDFIALENEYITDLIGREVRGERREAVEERRATYDEYMRYRLASTMLIYRDLYPALGSFEVTSLKWSFDIASYYNMWGHFFINDLHLDLKQIKGELRRKGPILQMQERFAEMFAKLTAELHQQGNYYRSNSGRFTYGIDHIDWLDEIFAPRPRRRIMEVNLGLFNWVREQAYSILHGGAARPQTLDLVDFAGEALI